MISVCIPTYNMHGNGVDFLKQALTSLQNQTNKNFEVVVSDDSTDDQIKDFLDNFDSNFEIRYCKNTSANKGASANLNNAIKNARYEIIKPLFQDDWIVNDAMIDDILMSKNKWGMLGWKTTLDNTLCRPKWSKKISIGVNTMGMPTGLFFQKNDALFFDEKLINLMDCDFYYRLYQLYGNPQILPETYYVARIWEGSISNTQVSARLNIKELRYIQQKRNRHFLVFWWLLYVIFFVKPKEYFSSFTASKK